MPAKETPDQDAVPKANEADETTAPSHSPKSAFTYAEDVAPGLRFEMKLTRMMCSAQSKYQKIDVVETYFGKTLITDDKTQSAEFDEFAYHESLVHPALLKSALLAGDNNEQNNNKPQSVFIGGGGELATAREILRHKSVERVVMVDVDEKVIELCKEYLPEWGGEAVANDPRLELIIGDAHAYLLDTKETFDVIVMDISDPTEGGPGVMLYTKEFYEHALTRLNMPHGVFVTQSGTADSIPPRHAGVGREDTSCFGPIHNTLRTVFDCVVPYTCHIPSFGGDWGFMMAFNTNANHKDATTITDPEHEWCTVSHAKIDNLIANKISTPLRFYDGITHGHMFLLTKPLRESLKADTRIMTKENPIFMF